MWKSKQTRPQESNLSGLAHKVNQLAAENKRMLEELGQMQQHFSGLARSVWRVQEDERRRLARELHDGVGQSLTALRHRLERMPASPDRDSNVVLVGQILEDVRELSRLLRPPVLDDLGLIPALQWLGRRVRESAGLPVEVEAGALEDLALDPELETLLFRVVQEALHNAVRHADASSAWVSAARAGNRIEVSIRDNGRGFDPETLSRDPEHAGVGLSGMRDRVKLFDGDMAIRSAMDRGTTITVGLPLAAGAGQKGGVT